MKFSYLLPFVTLFSVMWQSKDIKMSENVLSIKTRSSGHHVSPEKWNYSIKSFRIHHDVRIFQTYTGRIQSTVCEVRTV